MLPDGEQEYGATACPPLVSTTPILAAAATPSLIPHATARPLMLSRNMPRTCARTSQHHITAHARAARMPRCCLSRHHHCLGEHCWRRQQASRHYQRYRNYITRALMLFVSSAPAHGHVCANRAARHHPSSSRHRWRIDIIIRHATTPAARQKFGARAWRRVGLRARKRVCWRARADITAQSYHGMLCSASLVIVAEERSAKARIKKSWRHATLSALPCRATKKTMPTRHVAPSIRRLAAAQPIECLPREITLRSRLTEYGQVTLPLSVRCSILHFPR